MVKIWFSWAEFGVIIEELVIKIQKSRCKFNGVYGIPRGGLSFAVTLSHKLKLPLLLYPTKNTLVCDDISDTGRTLASHKNKKIVTLFSTKRTKTKPDWHSKIKKSKEDWIVFPWEL